MDNTTAALLSSLPVVFTSGAITIVRKDWAVGPSTFYYITAIGRTGGGASWQEAWERGLAANGGWA